jgi:hypothetical protein
VTSIHSFTERELASRALEHDCPDCGAKPNIRCRIVTHRPARTGYPAGTKVDVKRKPCPGRATIAWRAVLLGGLGDV